MGARFRWELRTKQIAETQRQQQGHLPAQDYIYVYVYISLSLYIYIYIKIFLYIYTHTYIHTEIRHTIIKGRYHKAKYEEAAQKAAMSGQPDALGATGSIAASSSGSAYPSVPKRTPSVQHHCRRHQFYRLLPSLEGVIP